MSQLDANAFSPADEKKNAFDHNEYTSTTPEQTSFKGLKTEGLTEAEVQEVRSAALAQALLQSPIDPRSRASKMLYFCCFTAFLGACANGYDGSLFSGISPMPYYQDYFQTGIVGQKVALVFSLYAAGSIIGPVFSGPCADYYGRRVAMFVGGAFIIIGMALVSSSHHLEQLIAGRFVLGFGIAFMTVGAPSYVTEIAPACWRGKFAGIYNNGWYGGSIPAAAITFGCSYIKSDWSWRLPMIGQGIPSAFVMVAVFFIPESPRWLVQKGRIEEARAILIKYHGNGDPDSALVRLEMAEMLEAEENSKGSNNRFWDYSELFMTKNARFRFLSVMMISIFGQFSGNGLGYFNNVIYQNLGYTSPQTQLGLNLGGSFVSAICGFTGAALADRMPRVKVLVYGTAVMTMFLAINGGLSEVWAQQPTDEKGVVINPNLAIGQGALAAYFLFGATFAFAYTAIQGIYPAENLTSSTRAKGLAASGIIVSLIGFINTYAGPIALQNMKNRYVFVFVGWDAIETLCWYLFGVETVGKTLEELDEIYNAPYPPFASRRKQKVAIKGTEIIQLPGGNDLRGAAF